jgi:hypothetical protein
MKPNKNQERMFENIYDLIKGSYVDELKRISLSDWETLSLKFFKQSKKDISKFIKNKNIEWNASTDNQKANILIGKHFKIELSII